MHRLKSLYISIYATALLAATIAAIVQLAAGGAAARPWWGVLLAAAAPLGFFGALYLRPVARTGAGLWWIPGAGLAGTAIAASTGGGLPLGIAAIVGLPMALLYTQWYSRFDARPASALTPGQTLAGLRFDTLDGTDIASEALLDAPALWLFYRGNWCPLCMAQIREVAARYREIAARGVAIHLVSPQSPAHTAALARRFDVPMRFLIDRDNRAATALGIIAEGGLPLGLQAFGFEADVPMPTVFITAAGGRIVYSDLAENYRVRPEPEALIAELDRAGLTATA